MRHRLSLTVLATMITFAQAAADPLDTSKWLVDLGRDYPRTQQAGLSDADGEITLLFMQAASRVNPSLAEAYRWQHDMLSALERDDEAFGVLTRYVELEPDDLSAHLHWIALRIEQLQTAEQRAEFCRTALRKPKLNGVVASDLHRLLAEFHHSRGEAEQALKEVRTAIEVYNLNFSARQMLVELTSKRQPDSVREAALLGEDLAELAVRPGDAILAWHIADRLAVLNLPEPADRFYQHAITLLRIDDPSGNLASVLTARVLTLRALGKSAEAETELPRAGEAWQALLARSRGTLDPVQMAEIAWFFVFFDPKPVEAEKLARVAVLHAPDAVAARRALGAALRLLGRMEEAEAELKLVAQSDPAAAGEYAQLLAAKGESDQARQILERAATQPAGPMGQAALRQSGSKLGMDTSAPTQAAAEARQAVTKFPWEVLDYPLRPDKYMTLHMEVPQRQLPPGEPWRLTARLRNIGTFPITLGPSMMVAPDALIEVGTTGDKPRTTGPTIPLVFNKTAVLAPGQSAEVTDTLELGPVRSGMIGTPQMAHEVTVNAVLSPVGAIDDQGQEVWTPGIGGLKAETLRFRRSAFVPDATNMAEVQRRLRSDNPKERIAALEVLTMLLAEAQHIQAGRLRYAVQPIDAALLQRLILSRAADPDWQVRARLAECLRWFVLDKDATNAAAQLMNDPHWLVRGLILRALADQYGTAAQSHFPRILAKASQADADEWVRRFAAALHARATASIAEPATQPAEGR